MKFKELLHDIYRETQKTVNIKNIYEVLLCYKEIAKHAACERYCKPAAVISLWFEVCSRVLNFLVSWSLHNQHSSNISGIHGFPSLAVSYVQISFQQNEVKLKIVIKIKKVNK